MNGSSHRRNSRCWYGGYSLFPFLCLLLLSSVLGWAQQASSSPSPHPSVLNLKIEAITLRRADMDEALTTFRNQNKHEIMIGFEEVHRVSGRQRKSISIEATQITVGALLNKFIAADPRYTYEVTKDSVINVFPRG